MDWVSFDEIKKTVSLKMVIDRYGWPLRKGGANVFRGRCPLPTHGSDRSKESFIATLDKGTGGAWSCHSNSCAAARGGKKGGNVLDLVAVMEKCSIRDAAIKLQTWFLVEAAGKPQPPGQHPHEPQESSGTGEPKKKLALGKNGEGGESECNKPLIFALQKIDHAHPYLAERGITEETARTFGVGFFPGKGTMSGRIVIPIHNPKGECVAYAGRAMHGTEPRYKFPAGFHKSLELFNLHRVKGEFYVVVVEGFFDCMKVMQAGFPCVALMGCTMNEQQRKLLADHFGEVILMFDGDGAGRAAEEAIGEQLREKVYLVKTVGLQDGVQPDQLCGEEIRSLLGPIV